jgi:HK97 family phage major capsid protein
MFIQLTKDLLGKKTGEKISVDDSEARDLVDRGYAREVPGDPVAETITKSITGTFEKFSQGLDQAVNTALKSFAGAQSKSRKNAVPAIFGEGGAGDPRGKSFGDWAKNVAIANSGGHGREEAIKRLNEEYHAADLKAALGESSGVTGGYIVPPDFYNQLLTVAAEESTFRQNAFVMPMASAALQFPYLDITTVPTAGQSPFFGGVVANWTQEAQVRTETEPRFKMMELKAQELSGYSVSSNILIQDAAFGLEKFLYTIFGKAVAWYEEFAFLQGNGVGKPLGVLKAPAAIAVTRNTAGHFYFADLATMLSKLLPASYDRAHWYVSPTVVPDLIQLKDGADRAIFLSIDMGAAQKPVWKLLNLPVHITEKTPALGTKGDVMLVDPSLYVIGDRMMLEVAASEHVNFLYNQMTWRFVQRVDGRPWLESYVTLQDATSTVSPFVVLN